MGGTIAKISSIRYSSIGSVFSIFRSANPIGCSSSFFKIREGQRKEPHPPTTVKIATDMNTGLLKGMIIFQNMVSSEPPSTRAASR